MIETLNLIRRKRSSWLGRKEWIRTLRAIRSLPETSTNNG